MALRLGDKIGPPPERICCRASRCGDNDAVGTLREREVVVDVHFKFNHVRDFARVQYGFVESGVVAFTWPWRWISASSKKRSSSR